MRVAFRGGGLLALCLSLTAAVSAREQWSRFSHEATEPRPVTYVLMINGGGQATQNFQSHLLQIQQLRELLERASIPRDHVSIFSGDGEDPAPDLAVRESLPNASFWLVKETSIEQALAPPTLENSAIPGVALEAATKANLRRWFQRARRQLGPGDTLLLYVTDHGTRNKKDPLNNRIILWGKDEVLSVTELGELLSQLDPRVQVVLLMSQCYSGGFARLASVDADDGRPAAVCGFFSSTADRPAYGCYPENRGVENLGHSFEFFNALATTGSFARSHDEVLVRDGTPDVPIRSSDVYLEELLRRAARERGKDFSEFVDELLREAWRNRAGWEPEIRLLDRIGHAYGFFSARSLSEIEEQRKRLPEVADAVRSQAKGWKTAVGDLKQANLDALLSAEPAWAQRASPATLRDLDPAARGELRDGLLSELQQFTQRNTETSERLELLKSREQAASAAAYRMEVRTGAVLRMRAILVSIAGRQYLRAGPPPKAEAFRRLQACENQKLDIGDGQASLLPATREPFPPYEEDLKVADEFLPAWMGIGFQPLDAKSQVRLGVGEGAAKVIAIYPSSPAKAAGFEAGDIVLGTPGAPFTTRNQVREWTMLSKIGEPRTLEILRDGRRMQLTLTPESFPRKWPDLPGPPKIGSRAPELELSAYRGAVPSLDGQMHLLFFWATWCAPCKASIPEVLAFGAERHTPVIAITDESREALDGFVQRYTGPFPSIVAIDGNRRGFLAYGVSGTPTFVLVDGEGRIRSYSTGYSPDKGIGVDGWSWSKLRGDRPGG